MDANGTRFHLLTGEHDWSPESVLISADEDGIRDARWDGGCGALTLAPRVFLPSGAERAARELGSRRGAAADRHGNGYRIADDRYGVEVRSAGSQVSSRFWPVPDPAASETRPVGVFRQTEATGRDAARVILSGLAITCHHRMVVGFVRPETREAGVLVFDLFTPAPPVWVAWPLDRIEGGAFEPFDIAPTPDGGVLVLDRVNRRLWGMDGTLSSLLQRVTDPERESRFKPVSDSLGRNAQGGEPVLTSRLVPLRTWSPIDDPVAIEAISREVAVVLVNRQEKRFSLLQVVHPAAAPQSDEVLSTEPITAVLAPGAASAFELIGHDLAWTVVPDTGSTKALARLFIVGARRLQACAFDLHDGGEEASPRYALEPSPGYYPLYGFTNRALLVFGSRPYYDSGERWVMLNERPRRRFRRRATVDTSALDGRAPDCVWHRVLVDGSIPRGAGLRVFTRAAESVAELDSIPWREERPPVLRRDGSEIPHTPRHPGPASGLPDETGTFDTLLQSARGRYLQIRLELLGDGTLSPRVEALRVYYPRFSYLDRYLPAVYRQDASSASFLDRWLSLFEGFYTPIEDRIAAAQNLFDARSAPREALDWLASWLGVVLDPAWDEDKRRLFLRHAADFFRMRGTVRGVVAALELALGECSSDDLFDDRISPARRGIRIVERFMSRRLPGVIAGDPTELDGLREVRVDGVWRLSDGGAALSARYRLALASAGVAEASQPLVFPVREPTDGTRELWRTFCKYTLGFVPLAGDADVDAWRAFLLHRHGTFDALRLTYGQPWVSLDEVPLPAELPRDGDALEDWYTFEGRLAIGRYAHQFVVVLPVRPGDAGGSDEYQARLELARRIAGLEKPAHTTFEVRFYWAMFRVGEARLGTESVVHRDRTAELIRPFALDRTYLAEGFLAPRPPGDATDRFVLGRDGPRARAEET